LLLGIEAIPASIQDRDSAAELIKKTRRLFADGGYSGDRLAADLAAQQVTLEIVKRTDKEGGFKLIRRRWVIERTFSWIRQPPPHGSLRSHRHRCRGLCQTRHDIGYAQTPD